MNKIPLRHITFSKEPDPSEIISVRDIDLLLAGKDMTQGAVEAFVRADKRPLIFLTLLP